MQNTGLWRRSLGATPPPDQQSSYERLRSALDLFRTKVSSLGTKISGSLPDLTVHDVTHMDALWETADIVAGAEYPLNPIEAFVFGGAVLLHDAGLCFEAYEGGLCGIRNTPQWRDAFALERKRNSNTPLDEIEKWADFATLRSLHAAQARQLAERGWIDPDTNQEIFLIEDYELRKRYAAIIGLIASSHHWPIEDLTSKLPHQLGAYSQFPIEWRVDPVKLACLLRCADAAHLDSRRAPDFLHALTRRKGISLAHWRFQNWLARLDIDLSDSSGETAVFTSHRSFSVADFDAWWIAFDAITLLEGELQTSNSLLQSRPQNKISPPFKIKRIAGTSSPEQMSQHLPSVGWQPKTAKLHVDNVEQLVSRLGGEALYGKGSDHLQTVLREFIQNARDAVAARRSVDLSYKGTIKIRIFREEKAHVLEIEDDGLGMSERVMTGPLLDFGTSFWVSDLVKVEFPGLSSSTFKSVGRYGIGFYSIFMISDDVQICSRRWDRGLDSICTLHFPKGLSLRPIVSKRKTANFSSYTSTLVSCRLKDGILPQELVKTLSSGLMGVPDIEVKFSDYLAALILGVDVDVELDLDGTITNVHRIIGTMDEIEKREWLSKVSFSEYQTDKHALEKVSARLRPIIEDNSIVAFAALDCSSTRSSSLRGVKTIGGMAPPTPLRTMSGFVGFMETTPASAKRDTGDYSFDRSLLQKWADDQIHLLRAEPIDLLSWCYATSNLATLDLDPSTVFHALFARKGQYSLLSIDLILQTLTHEKIAILKSSSLNHVETNTEQRWHQDYLTFVPVANGKLLSLEFEAELPKVSNSFIGCLDRRARYAGYKLTYSEESNIGRSFFGSIDALLLSVERL